MGPGALRRPVPNLEKAVERPRRPVERRQRIAVAAPAVETRDPGQLVRSLLRLVERLGWRFGTAACLVASALASLAMTAIVQLALGVPPEEMWVGAVISLAVPIVVATPGIALALRLVEHLAGLRHRLEREVERRAAAEARLRRLVGEDELTGLGNRRDFVSRARTALAIGRRFRHAVGILLIDIDSFKQVNDRHGHQVGDEALVRVARVLRKELRATDTPARLGGDEFVALLPQIDVAAAVVVAERIRLAITDDAAEPALTVTIGCVVSGNSRAQLAHLLRAADQALYAGKRAGRNRVFVAGRGGPTAAVDGPSPTFSIG
jgi:diguanylate cyclase (GGDEF)-like protein